MLNLNKDKFFFFYDDCSFLKLEPNSLEHGYLALLNDNLISASLVFNNIDSPRAKWASVLVQILNGRMEKYPTYFQIRNFFEIDLDLLLKNEKLDYIELLVGALELLLPINREVYKYTGRVLYENKLYAASLNYFEKAKKVYYNDAELHFLLANYFFNIKDFNQAYFYINECLKILSDYYPAHLLKEEIEQSRF